MDKQCAFCQHGSYCFSLGFRKEGCNFFINEKVIKELANDFARVKKILEVKK